MYEKPPVVVVVPCQTETNNKGVSFATPRQSKRLGLGSQTLIDFSRIGLDEKGRFRLLKHLIGKAIWPNVAPESRRIGGEVDLRRGGIPISGEAFMKSTP